MPDGMLDRISEALPAYAVTREVGRGTFGTVFAGQHLGTSLRVAIKSLEPHVAGRFAAGARVLTSLDHPHVAPLYDSVEGDGLYLLVTEWLDGGTLPDRLFGPASVDVATACTVAMITCAGLHHAHLRGVRHGNLTPDNLRFHRGDDVLKITDLGIAQMLALPAGTVAGNPAYKAPEQVTAGAGPAVVGTGLVGPGADIYATGLILYELLGGRLPFSDKGTPEVVAMRRVDDDPVPLDRLAPDLAGPLAEVTMRALSRAPHARFASAEQFGVAIGRAASQVLGDNWLDDSKVDLLVAGRIADAAQSSVVQSGPRVATSRSIVVRPERVAPTATSQVPPPPREFWAERRPAVPAALMTVLALVIIAVLAASGSIAAVRLNRNSKSVTAPPTSQAPTTLGPAPLSPGGASGGPPPHECRNDFLGYRLEVPHYISASPDSSVLGPCEALDAVRLNPGDGLNNGWITSPIAFRRLAGTFDQIVHQDRSPLSVFATKVSGRPTAVVENILANDIGPFKAGSRTYTYYIDAVSSVLAAQLLISPVEPLPDYQSHKQVFDATMASLQLVPTVCNNYHLTKCGDLYFSGDVSHGPVTVLVSVSPTAPHQGETVTLSVTAHNDDADLLSCTPSWGDAPGATPASTPEPTLVERIRSRAVPVSTFGPWDPPTRHPQTKAFAFTHIYKDTATFTAGADCTADSSAAQSEGLTADPFHAIGSGHAPVTVS